MWIRINTWKIVEWPSLFYEFWPEGGPQQTLCMKAKTPIETYRGQSSGLLPQPERENSRKERTESMTGSSTTHALGKAS